MRKSILLIVAVVLAFVFYKITFTHPSISISLSATPAVSSPVVHQSIARPLYSASLPHSVVGPPTITASFIDRVLNRAHSPAWGIGHVMYQQGVKYGIDPVYALAFFHHESSFGLAGVARSTHSIGNIRCTQGYTCDASGGYRSYPSYASGVADWYSLLASVYIPQGLTTVEKIIPVYAPNADHNNESAYIASVNSDVAQWREGRV